MRKILECSGWLSFWLLIFATPLPGTAGARLESAEVNLNYVVKRAEERARKPFHSPRGELPAVLRADKLNYDKYREIEFRHEKALWAAERLPFRVEFFHPGYLFEEPIYLHEFTLTHVQPIRFVQDFFNYRALKIQKQIPSNTGYAGFRLLNRLNDEGKWDEIGSFLGASYFRLLGKNQRYGQSARGLAIDCGEPDRPEEFPLFTTWWLGKPHRDDDALRLYAILDSVSAAGAYEFIVHPGDTTVAEVEAVVFLRDEKQIRPVNAQRKPVATLGLAPLTSMYWFGENCERKFDDYRPEVHDSDGLLMKMETGEVLWRPLNNASVMRHQRFATKNIRGFGLMQRDRDFDHYQDIFNFYQDVPGVWIEPRGHWGAGEVHLVELSTHYEGLDNIVAFWNPKDKPAPLEPLRFAYTMYWTRDMDARISPNRAAATRIGRDKSNGSLREFVIDFAGPELSKIPKDQPPQAIASCSDNGKITEVQVFRNQFDGLWRVILKMLPLTTNAAPIDIRCTLKHKGEVKSETWTYHWSPP